MTLSLGYYLTHHCQFIFKISLKNKIPRNGIMLLYVMYVKPNPDIIIPSDLQIWLKSYWTVNRLIYKCAHSFNQTINEFAYLWLSWGRRVIWAALYPLQWRCSSDESILQQSSSVTKSLIEYGGRRQEQCCAFILIHFQHWPQLHLIIYSKYFYLQ